MDNALRTAIVRFVQLTLDDDHGISDAAMDSLVDLRDLAHKMDPVLGHHLAMLCLGSDGTMGRNYTAK